MSCEDTFTCASEIHILSYEIEGEGWFVVMLILALLLQVAANYVWIQNSQITRELLQMDIDKRGTWYSGKLGGSMWWTLISTLIWIARIILVMGSNLYIFIIVLIGNLVGVYSTQMNQKPDHQYLADDILLMLRRFKSQKCDDSIKCKIKKALQGLRKVMDEDDMPESSGRPSTEQTELLTF